MEYKELFNRAKAAYGTGAYDDATLEFLFPDLKVSEDERIRKHIVEILKRLLGCHWYGQKEKDDCLAYLEKQKEPRDYRKLYEDIAQSEWFKKAYVGKSLGEDEQKEQKPITESKRLANEVIEYLTKCGYSPVLKDDSKKEHFHIDIPRHKDDFRLSEEYKHCRSVLGEYYMEGNYGGDTYTLYIWRAKKKQKPEWNEADEVYLEDALWCVDKAEKSCKDGDDKGACWSAKRWLKSLPERFEAKEGKK